MIQQHMRCWMLPTSLVTYDLYLKNVTKTEYLHVLMDFFGGQLTSLTIISDCVCSKGIWIAFSLPGPEIYLQKFTMEVFVLNILI